jgi:coenzyme F420-reducing hydrogenase delta subunit
VWISKKELDKKIWDAQMDYASNVLETSLEDRRWQTVTKMAAELEKLNKKVDKLNKIVKEGY